MFRAYPDTGTGMSEESFNLFAIRGLTRGDGELEIEPRSPDSLSIRLPLRHRSHYKEIFDKDRFDCRC